MPSTWTLLPLLMTLASHAGMSDGRTPYGLKPIHSAAQECLPRMTRDEAQGLLQKALQAERPAWTSLPKFGIDSANVPEAERDGIFDFDLTWDNPVGSLNLSHYSVNAITAEIWESFGCRPLKSRKIQDLQRSFQKRTCLSANELKKASRANARWCWK